MLEHTTGWSYWYFAELGSDDPKPKTLKEALDFYPKSRISNFVPGTRVMESNVGTATAAYIVEKVSGLSFEDYIDKYFFDPIGMNSMTYLYSEQYKKFGAHLYDNGIRLNYFHILYRPAAALSSSPIDMVQMVRFFINRGKINNTQILSEVSLQRMERSGSMGELSKREIFKDYGLANMPSYYKGFVYHGHGGSLPGGTANFGYLPEYNKGYAVMINGSDESAVHKITSLIKYYQTKDLKQKPIEVDNKKCEITNDPSGYYTIIIPKIDKIGFIERIKNIQKVWVENDTLFIKNPLRGKSTRKYLLVANNEFRLVGSNKITLVLLDDPLDGQIILSNNFFKQISPLWAYSLMFIFTSFFIILASTVFFAIIWTLVYLFGKTKNKIALWISLWPLITSAFVFIIILSIMIKTQTRYDLFQLFGTANPISVLLFICSICYALASVWSVYYIFKNRRVKMTKFFYFHSALAAILHLIYTLYFISNGLIGIPTWI